MHRPHRRPHHLPSRPGPPRRCPGVALPRWALAAALSACVAAAPRPARADPPGSRLAGAIELALRHADLGEVRVGIRMDDLASGHTLFRLNAADDFVPAELTRLVTAAAALDALGPEHRFVTRVLADDFHRDGGVRGDLYVEGNGDPTLDAARLDRLALELHASGLRRVEGRLLVAEPAPGPGLRPAGPFTLTPVPAPVLVLPGRESGAPPRVLPEPLETRLAIVNDARTSEPGGTATLMVRWRGDGDPDAPPTWMLSGEVPLRSGPALYSGRWEDPAQASGEQLAAALAARGIAVTGPVGRAALPDGALELGRTRSAPLGVMLRELGSGRGGPGWDAVTVHRLLAAAAGGAAAGPDLLQGFLLGLGAARDSFRLDEGAGSSPANRLSPDLLVELLRWVHGDLGAGPELTSALAFPASRGPDDGDDGEPRSRRVRALTAAGLGQGGVAGFLETEGGTMLAFAIMMDGVGNRPHEARLLQDKILAIASRYHRPG